MREYDYTCPECGGQMILKTNGQTRNQFYGCVFYPECTGTREVGGESKAESMDYDVLPSERAAKRDKQRWRE